VLLEEQGPQKPTHKEEDMSKKNGKSRANRDGASAPQTNGGDEKAPRKKLTVPERLVAKAQIAYDVVDDLVKMTSFHGAPQEIVDATKNLLVEIDIWRGTVKELVAGGWQPVAKGEMKDLATGDKIKIKDTAKDLYSYISEGTLLAVDKIDRSENGRIKRLLLVDERSFGETGVPAGSPTAFGWALLAHIERR